MTARQIVDWRAIELDFPLENEPAWRGDPYSLPVPNAAMRAFSSISDIEAWYAIGEAWAHIASRFSPPDPTVLDIGCGCGKIARFLYLNPQLRYIGVDLFLPAIIWCRRAFEEHAGARFRFEHFDGISAVYNPQGKVRPSEYRLPVDDATIDMTICASLFTHLLERDCVHYLEEIQRVLKIGGKTLISIHNEPPAGQRFAGDETRVDIQESFFLTLADKAGLSLSTKIGNIYGQQLFLLERLRTASDR